MEANSYAYSGHLAGLATSLLWTISPLLFTAAARRLGPTTVNSARIAFALVLLGITHRLLFGQWSPEVIPRQMILLAVSGFLGLTLGDQALLVAYLDIGPRLAALIMTAAPLFAALCGWAVLGEELHAFAWLGIALTVAGVAWVVLDRPERGAAARSPRWGRGVTLSLLAAACQAGGLLFSKQGMGHGWLDPDRHLAPQAAALVRMLFAALGMLPFVAWRGWLMRRRPADGFARPRAGSSAVGLWLSAGGAVVGPFLGVWMSLVASDRAPLGVAQTLCSLPPLFILPFARMFYRERIGSRAVIGAIVSVAGTALLFLKPS